MGLDKGVYLVGSTVTLTVGPVDWIGVGMVLCALAVTFAPVYVGWRLYRGRRRVR